MNGISRAASFLLMAALSVFSLAAQAPDPLPESYATAGLFYNSYTTPHITGFGAYAKKVADSTYSYTVIDVTSRSLKNFKPETSTTSGIAQHLKDFNGVGVFGIVTAGVATAAGINGTGADVGFSGSGGFLLVKPLKNGWSVNLPVRIIASTLGPPQYVLGVGVGWGK